MAFHKSQCFPNQVEIQGCSHCGYLYMCNISQSVRKMENGAEKPGLARKEHCASACFQRVLVAYHHTTSTSFLNQCFKEVPRMISVGSQTILYNRIHTYIYRIRLPY